MEPSASPLSTRPPAGWWQFFNLRGAVSRLWARREVISQLARREVESLYRESLLGSLWSLIQPLVLLGVYTFVFLVLFGVTSADVPREELVLGMFSGIVAYTFFAENINRAPGLVVANPNFVKKIVFPLEALPVSVLCSTMVNLGSGLVILLAGKLWITGSIPATALLLPVVLLPLILFTLGLSLGLAALGVFVRDVEQAVRAITQVLFFLTPIFWRVDAIDERYRPWVMINPLTTIVENVRDVAVSGQTPNWLMFSSVLLVSALTLSCGYTLFMKTRQGFADVL